MTSDLGPLLGRHPFVGRQEEVAALNAATANPAVRIICVHGDRGAGKTTLASQLFYHHRDSGAVFDATRYLSAHGKIADVLVDEIHRMVSSISARRSYVPSELPGLLRETIEAQSGDQLLFVDNVESDVIVSDLLAQCLHVLATTTRRCTLLLTSRDPLPEAPADEAGGRRNVHLEGIRETAAVLSILGDSLRFSHTPQELVRMADTIGRLPQRLLYCRWAQPTDIQAFAQRFAEQQQPLSIEALRQVLGRLTNPLPLLACGVLRGTDINTGLLAWLTESVSDGTGAPFAGLLEELLGHRLVAPLAGAPDGVRIHPDTHVDLTRLCEERGKGWLRRCHRAAWEYFRARCADIPDDLTAVGELVHHGLALGEFDDAYGTVFDDNRVERWRRRALSIRIEPILEELRTASRQDSVIATQQRRADISVELAHVASDLGRPNLCLEHLIAAQQELDGLARTDALNTALRQLWTQMAISHANLGDTARCIHYYRMVIASDPVVMEMQTALCMGYLGYEYCDFENFGEANRWSQRALDSCSFERSPQVYSKNLGNRGLVLYYEGRLAAASTCLNQAVELVSSVTSPAHDVREHGRALSHLAMVELAQGHPADAVIRRLRHSLELARQAGDARRTALTEGRLGIVAGRIGAFDRAENSLHHAIVSHSLVGDIRNMIFELLALLSIRHRRAFGTFGATLPDLERAAPGIHPELARLIGSSISSPDKHYLVEFWLNRQQPRLFGPARTRQ
jgi:tetratricopeptide (TPR) repeat protein